MARRETVNAAAADRRFSQTALESRADRDATESDASVQRWLEGLRAGDPDAAESLWRCCFPELVRYARQRLRGVPRRIADEEDVALSAMDSLFRGVQEGRFSTLADTRGLLRLLLRITARKAADMVRRETRQFRGGGHVRGDSAFGNGACPAAAPMQQSPELSVAVEEEVRRLFELLPDSDLQTVAIAKMDGASNEEVATTLGCSIRTVERRLHLIRRIWERDDGQIDHLPGA